MTPNHLRRLEQLYFAALSRPMEERGPFLAKACRSDDALRREVESLLEAPASTAGIFGPPALAVAAGMVSDNLFGVGDESAAVTVARAAQAQPSPMLPIEVLLRRRLLMLSLGFASLAGFATVVFLWTRLFPALRQGAKIIPAVWAGVAMYTVLVVVTAVFSRVLWSPRRLSLRSLRMIETVGFAMLAVSEVERI